MQSLQQSLASGNLNAAQSAFNTYQQLNQSLSTASGTSSSSSSGTTSQLSTDMTALGSAIGSGDLSTAQSAFATVQSDLQTTPSQAITNAEGAVAQTVQWVEDLLNISGSNSSSTTPLDPTTSMLDSAYGINTPSTPTDPTTTMLDSAYDAAGAGTSSTGTASSAGSSSASSIPSDGNSGSGASVNAYA